MEWGVSKNLETQKQEKTNEHTRLLASSFFFLFTFCLGALRLVMWGGCFILLIFLSVC